jgi:hypothetical protein
MRKPRSDSKLMTLDAELQREIFQHLLHEGYEDVRLWLKKEHRINTSNAALNKAYQYWSRQDLENRVLKSRGAADSFLDLVGGDVGKLDKATTVAIQQRVFELSLAGGDEKSLKDLFSMLLQSRKMDHDEQSLQLQVDRFQFNAAESALKHAAELKIICNDDSMTQSAKVDAVRRRLFGMIPEDTND